MANLKAQFHEHLTRPGVKYDKEMSICLLESDLKMSKSHTNCVLFVDLKELIWAKEDTESHRIDELDEFSNDSSRD